MEYPNSLFIKLFFVTCLLAGCAGVSREPLEQPGSVFHLEGRIAVRGIGNGLTASFVWDQFAERFRIELWGPLGQGRTRLTNPSGALVIHTPRGEVIADGDAEMLMLRELGWAIPLEVLPDWIQGRPAPGWPATAERLGPDDDLIAFDQLGWRIELSRHVTVEGLRRPGRLVATRGESRITLVCRVWR